MHQNSMCMMMTLQGSHIKAEKKKKHQTPLSWIFGQDSSLLCGFYDAVRLDVLRKLCSLIMISSSACFLMVMENKPAVVNTAEQRCVKTAEKREARLYPG